MIASILIIVFSTALFIYWFRYTCILILSEKSKKDYASQIASANQLQFLETRKLLSAQSASSYTSLHKSLDRDYRLVSYLLLHAANYDPATQRIDQLLLRLDYKMMELWYRVASCISKPLARRALFEMSGIIGHLANAVGEQVAISQRA